MHQLLFWGCLLAVAITFPLVFGWMHFRSAPDDQMTYVTYLFGFPVGSFRIRTVLSWLMFHGLDIAAVLVLAAYLSALWRRMRDQGALALQSFAVDFFPLILLFAISRDRAGADGLDHLAAGKFLRVPRHSACHHCDRRRCCICRSASSFTSFSDRHKSA